MFICIQILSRNKNAFKKFLKIFNKFYKTKQIKKIIYIRQKKLVVQKQTKYINFVLSNKKTIYKTYLTKYRIKKYCLYRKKKKRIYGFFKYKQQKQTRSFFTTLKSPHIYKTAQEQMEYRNFSKQIIIFSFQILKYIILLKKLQTNIFPDIEIQIKFLINNKFIEKKKLTIINPNIYRTKSFKYFKIDKSSNLETNISKKATVLTLTIKFLKLYNKYIYSYSILFIFLKKNKFTHCFKQFKTRVISSIFLIDPIKKNQIVDFIRLFDSFGELSFKNCLDSSVGRAKD